MKLKLVIVTFSIALALRAQRGSGSSGADGALVLTAPGVVVFDPATFDPPLKPRERNVFQFTSIYIASGVTLRLSAKVLHNSVYWLVQGPVQIDGTISLDGEDGVPSPFPPNDAGAGGYVGALRNASGYGPKSTPGPGAFIRNKFLVPLVGGSGGAGGQTQSGGAGGGALLIVSTASITVNGAITANGGASFDGIGGGGGAIRLVAPDIEGNGIVSAKGGQPQGIDGLVRFESLHNGFTGNFNNTPAAFGKPLGLFLPPDPSPSVRILSIGGQSVAGEEFTIHQSSPVPVVVEARNIPIGTVIQLEFFSEKASALEISTTPLKGSFALSWATASISFPGGLSHGYIRTSWSLPPRGQPTP